MRAVDSVDGFLAFATRFASLSKSQLLQDLWVVWELGFERERVFVDIGAADGIFLSNTALLEQLGWTGVLVEANSKFYPDLRSSRTSPAVHKCVWSESGRMMALRSVNDFQELSRLEAVQDPDNHEAEGRRAQFEVQEVESITLLDLLMEHGSPRTIDYMSMDIEGSEYEALKAFDFSRFKFRCLTIEHNYTNARDKIHSLLGDQGYRRKWPEISAWDDWYVLAETTGLDVRTPPSRPAQEPYRRLHQLREERGEAAAAAALASEMIEIWPEDATLGCKLAASFLAQGALPDAERVVTAVLERHPTSGAAHNLNSHLLAQLGRLDAAALASARAVELNPDQRSWRVRHGSLLLRLGRFEDAAGVLRAVVEDSPDDVSALVNLARACDALGRGEEAVAFAGRAAALAPEDAAVGKLLMKLRKKWTTQASEPL